MRYDTTPSFGSSFSSSTSDVKAKGELQTLLSSFWDCLWTWKYEGSTGVPEWDKRLTMLANSAGLFVGKVASCLILDETFLDRLASLKGWEKIEVSQPTMASYSKNDNKIEDTTGGDGGGGGTMGLNFLSIDRYGRVVREPPNTW
jgi:hypothetical protein